MADVDSKTEPTERLRFGSLGGWLLAVFFTAGYLFMFSGAICHSLELPVHPRVGTLGWVLAGLSPLITYISYQLLRRRYGTKRGRSLSAIIAVAVFLLCQILGMTLLQYALPGQPLRLG